MSGRTLGLIAKYLKQPLGAGPGVVQFPFNVELFCQENDAMLNALEAEVEMRTKAHFDRSKEVAELTKEIAQLTKWRKKNGT